MQRLFIRFYLFLLILLVGLGWSIEQLWQLWADPELPASVPYWQQQIQLSIQLHESALALRESLAMPNQVLAPGSVQWSDTEWQALQQGEVLPLFTHGSELYLFAMHQAELWQFGPIALDTASPLRPGLSVLFFILLAIAVALWLWPIARDIKQLQRDLGLMGQGQSSTVSVPAHSVLAPIAESVRQMQAQIQRLLSLQKEMTHAVSHELRTPLARLNFALEMAQHLTEQERQLMQQDVRVLQQLVNEMLDYARLEVAMPELQPSSVDMVELLQSIQEQLSVLPGPSIELQLPAACSYAADGHYLERAIVNLLQNAKGYARQRIIVSLEQKNSELWLHVDDDGPGVAEAMRQQITKPFQRLDEPRRPDTGGFGLGLAIVCRIMEWHHGRLLISNAPLGGARFSLVLKGRDLSGNLHPHPG